MKILVLGIGNTLLADEGVGIVAMHELEARFGAREDMEFIDGGTLSFTLAVPISECDALLVIDAAELGAARRAPCAASKAKKWIVSSARTARAAYTKWGCSICAPSRS